MHITLRRIVHTYRYPGCGVGWHCNFHVSDRDMPMWSLKSYLIYCGRDGKYNQLSRRQYQTQTTYTISHSTSTVSIGYLNTFFGYSSPGLPQCQCSKPGEQWLAGLYKIHDDVIQWKHFPRYWPSVRSPVNSPHKVQWRGALMLSLICAWINSWVHNREAGDLRRHRAHYGVIVMLPQTRKSTDSVHTSWEVRNSLRPSEIYTWRLNNTLQCNLK